MGNETFYGDGRTGNRQWPFKQANHDAYSNLGTLVGGPVEGFRRCFADVLNQSFIVLSVAQAVAFWREFVDKVILRKQPTLHNATNGFPARWRLRNEPRNSILMTYTTLIWVVLLLGWKFVSGGEFSIRKSQVRLCVVNFILFSRNTLSNRGQHSWSFTESKPLPLFDFCKWWDP